jgi:hypothetical protein
MNSTASTCGGIVKGALLIYCGDVAAREEERPRRTPTTLTNNLFI